jgi:hypothetical protein
MWSPQNIVIWVYGVVLYHAYVNFNPARAGGIEGDNLITPLNV